MNDMCKLRMNRLIVISCFLFSLLSLQAKDGFAIVVDQNSYEAAQNEIKAYASCVETVNKYKTYIVVDKSGIPDTIRQRLLELYNSKTDPIVGTVLIGDIPVAMVRDAQFMTSAFKMNQKNDRRESSVPSDRFYDCFSLRFQSLGKDSIYPYYYYSLSADGPQTLRPEIFSGRIRPTDCGGTSRIEKLRAYLRKVVAEKTKRHTFKNVFFFSGHGFISESKVARMDEKIAYFEHFPQLRTSNNCISYMDHTDAFPIKVRVMNEVMRKDLSLAVMHHHGYFDTQYFNGLEPINTVRMAKEFIIRNAREHVNHAKQVGKNSDSLRSVLEKRFDLPSSWLADVYSDSLNCADSTYEAGSDLHLEDFKYYGYTPNVPFVIIDACFCGSFHLDNCIANEYIFQEGATIATLANSVNVLQDKWSDRFLGLIANGACVGQLAQLSQLLESHLIGDPTFTYDSEYSLPIASLLRNGKTSQWRKLLKSSYPDVQALAINQLNRERQISSDELFRLFHSSPYGVVRLEALMALSTLKNDQFVEAIAEATQDSYELLQRQAIRMVARSGDARLIPSLIQLAIANNTSDRCNFNVTTALNCFPKDQLLAEFDKQFLSPHVAYIHKDSVYQVIRKVIERGASLASELEDVMNPDVKESTKIFAIRSMRNTPVHFLMPQLIDYLKQCNNETIQVTLLEALGWHTFSCQVPLIERETLAIGKDTRYSDAVRKEALKTYHRIHEN